MEGVFLVLIGAAIFCHSWSLLGLYHEGRTMGTFVGGLGLVALISLTMAPMLLVATDAGGAAIAAQGTETAPEARETELQAVEREVLEESGVVARVSDVVGVRHSVGAPTANIYVVFRLDPVSGEPRYDGDETIGAGYFNLAEIGSMLQVQALSTWAFQTALQTPRGGGFARDQSAMSLSRPGWTLFGPTGAVQL